MNKMKRVLSIILSVMLLVGTLPAGVFAEETSGTQLSENSGAVQESSLEDSSIPEDSEDSETGDSSSEDSDSTTIDSEVVTDSQNENIATASEEEIDAQANENTIIIAGGDFQEAGDHTASSENVKNILAQVSKTYDSVDGFLFIGDYDCETHDDSTQTASGITALMEAVQSVYSNINDDNSVLAQGNHDYMDSRIDATGGHDFDEYSAFVLNEDDYPNYGGTESGVKALATQLETYLTAKIQAAYDKPIFIVSHLPLAFTPRTNVQGDAKYAKYLFDVLNAGGEAGLNIIFLHGHDHAYGYEEYLGGEAIYLPKGDKINIAEVGSQSSYTTETLNFTYMNAGYTGYYNEFGYTTSNAGTNMLTMTTFEITDSSVIVSRYNANGTYNLKTAGELKGNHINNVSVSANTDVYTTTQTIELTTPETPNTVADSNGSGATVTANGITGTTVTSAIKNVDGYSAYVTYSISVNNYTQGDEATVVVPVDTTLFDVNKPVKVLDNGNVIKTTSIVNGTVTFTTNHFSDYDVTQVAETEWVEIGSDETFYTYELDTNGIDTGSSNKYLIVGYESGSSSYDYALTAEGSNTGAISVDISGNTITTSTRNYEWYITTGLVNTNSTNYKYFITQDGSTWLYHTDSSMFIGGTSVGSTKYSRGFWRIETSNQNNGVYTFRDKDNADWYLRYSASGGKFTVSTDTYSVRLYKYSGTTTGEKIYVALNSFNGSVVQNANANASTGATIAIKDSTETVNVTIGMLTDANGNAVSTSTPGTYTGLTVTYKGVVLTNNFTLTVIEKAVNHYPSYPDEGAVKVNKTAEGVNFQETGVAKVELSASGVPNKKGADVIIMVDTSSSMNTCLEHGTRKCSQSGCQGNYRADVFEESLADLIAQFKTPGEDGELLDLRVALADFNGFNINESNSPYYIDRDDDMNDGVEYAYKDSVYNNASIFTGTKDLTAGAFVEASELASSYNFTYYSGTNYDYAFDAIYQLGHAIQEQNEANGEERDLYVIFMSDGAPMQYNYYHAQGNSVDWSDWLLGNYTEDNLNDNIGCDAHRYYYDMDNGNKHRMAEAVKGNPTSNYTIVRKATTGLEDVLTSVKDTEGENMYTVPGLGATVFSIAFCPAVDGNTTVESMLHTISSAASTQTGSTQYYYDVDTADELANAFTSIGSEIAYAASNARFVDTMGENYDIQLANYVTRASDGQEIALSESPAIEVKSYTIWTRAEYEAGECTLDDIGKRKTNTDGSYIYTVLEKVTFDADGTKAYSDKIDNGKTNILNNGVICANTFWYNTNSTAVDIDTNGDGTVDYSLAAETFYWKVGTITTYELALSYYVYLTDAMSGKEAGSYPTNESAVLYYTNYLGKEDCYKTTVSPVLAWKAANVSYAFYLVNSDGQPVNANGDVVTFANKVTIVNPTLYKEVLLNSAGGGNVNSLNIVANNSNVLPTGYTLYDYNAEYTVIINSDATGSWSINNSKTVASTYVTDYSSTEQYTNATSSTSESDAYDYTHTTVWFAVVWEPQALPDTVVIDYGLPVDIHVLTNDMFGDYGKLLGVAKGDVKEGTSQSFNGVSSTTVDGEYGTATVNVPTAGANESNSVVRYTPEDMEMNSYDKFTYSVQYANSNYTQNNGYYYETVTVIPATTIYYEDSFVDYTSYTWDYDGDPEGWINSNGLWKSVTDETYVDDADITQDEDRPGNVNYAFDTVIDANNVYGYDSAYTECSQYSLGSAMMAHVDYDNMAEASFVFYGTGFDVVSMTSNQTGAITVEVFAADENGNKTGDAIRSHSVDTYYGYTYDEASGEWVTSINDPNALYQVPVMEIAGLDYSKYYVEIQVVYDQIFDHSQYSDKTFDFYLDAIRIYDPANDGVADNTADTTDKDDVTIENAYEADKESWPIYQELRNNVIEAAEITSEGIEEINGIVFIDSVDETAAVADYESVGPNNELYLSNGQAIAFNLDLSAYDTENVSSVQLGIKSVGGETTYKIFDGSKIANQNDLANVANTTISTATGMYYDITALSDKTIVICNTGDSILSITDLKITFKSNPGVVESLVYVNVTAVKSIIKSMNNDGSFVPTKFEVSVPQSVTVGKSIVVKVTTSSDVLTVSINGMMLNSYSKNADGSYTWTTSIKTTDEGTESIKVIAYNADGTASASETVEVKVNSVAETVTNTAKSIVKNVISWLSKLLS